MERRIRLVVVLVAVLFSTQFSFSQTLVNEGLPEHAISFSGFSSSDEVLHVNYEIPFAGVVTFALYNEDGRRVWQKQQPLERGPNRFSMRQAAFEEEESYSFVLSYKLSEVSGTVPLP